jgi:hypothetical protein
MSLHRYVEMSKEGCFERMTIRKSSMKVGTTCTGAEAKEE